MEHTHRVAFDEAEKIVRKNKYNEMERQPVINESKLREIIKTTLNEYRPYQKDGDVEYVGPDPEKDYDIGGFTPFNKRGKKVKTTSINDDGNRIVHQYGVTDFSHGKGNLCAKVADTVRKMFYQNDKIKWTYAEESYIDEIYGMILKLAQLTKQEGNRTRGYNGPE